MIKDFSQTLVFSFLKIFIFCSSCNGQVKKDLPKENSTETEIVQTGESKFKNSQSKNKGNNVHCSLQEKSGNLWFGTTADGIYKYDGKSFSQTRIIEDKKGNLWFGGLSEDDDLGFENSGGISRYDGKTFTRFTTKDGLRNNDIWTILEDKTGKIWIGTRGTILHRFDEKNFINFSE